LSRICPTNSQSHTCLATIGLLVLCGVVSASGDDFEAKRLEILNQENVIALRYGRQEADLQWKRLSLNPKSPTYSVAADEIGRQLEDLVAAKSADLAPLQDQNDELVEQHIEDSRNRFPKGSARNPYSPFELQLFRLRDLSIAADAVRKSPPTFDPGPGLGEEQLFSKGLEALNSCNYVDAVRLFRTLATMGHTKAQCNLGALYQSGRGVQKDLSQARKWYFDAAEHGSAPAQFNLGLMYQRGEGFEKNLGLAAKRFGQAAEEGYDRAQLSLAEMYSAGEGVPRSEVEATRLFKAAAEQGNTVACAWLKKQGIDCPPPGRKPSNRPDSSKDPGASFSARIPSDGDQVPTFDRVLQLNTGPAVAAAGIILHVGDSVGKWKILKIDRDSVIVFDGTLAIVSGLR